jgi:oligoendopeptidase F
MFHALPKTSSEALSWNWTQFEPYYIDLKNRPLSEQTIATWLDDWTALANCLTEISSRLYVDAGANTADAAAEQRYLDFLEQVFPQILSAEQTLKEKLLQSGLTPAGFEVPIRNLRAQAALFRTQNLPLFNEEARLCNDYNKIMGAQTVSWQGEETTIAQLRPVYQQSDRALREQAWRMVAERQLADRPALNELWQKLLPLRIQIAHHADQPDYRAYCWQQKARFDYTPADCYNFHRAIENAVLPTVRRILERRRIRLGVDSLRPWDLDVDPFNRPALHPFDSIDELKQHGAAIFHHVDPQLGHYFDILVSENLLDLENRKNKAPGAYCTEYPLSQRPFVFMNAVGIHDDVQTLLHETGHAFHVFEANNLRYHQQKEVPMEFAEVASMGMELLAAPYLSEFYSPADVARARVQHLEQNLLFWPYMAVVDAFQHWVYGNPDAAAQPENCDAVWDELWQRFMVGVDWSGLDDVRRTGWQRKLHIFTVPFYYIEYGLAQLGAVQVWSNALRNQVRAVAAYRRALSLGGSVPLPILYQTAGARLAFDVATLQEAVDLMEKTINELDA